MAKRTDRFHFDRRAGAIGLSIEGDDDRLLTEDEVAELTNMSSKWFEGARREGHGPPWLRVGARGVRYRVGDLRAYFLSRTENPGADIMSHLGKPHVVETKDGHLVPFTSIARLSRKDEASPIVVTLLNGETLELKSRDINEVLNKR